MYPILLETKFLVLPSWYIFFVLAAISCYFLLQYTNTELTQSELNSIYSLGYIGVYLGARAYSLIQSGEYATFFQFLSALFSPGPLTFFGGFFAASFFVIGYCLWQKISIFLCLDICAPCALFAAGIGRIGCFLNGDDFGYEVLLRPIPWWAVSFPNHALPLPRYPIQLIEALVLCSLMLALILLRKRIYARFFQGTLGILAILIYCIQRFFIEYWRADPRGEFIFSLSPAQVISLGVGLFAISTLILRGLAYRGKN